MKIETFGNSNNATFIDKTTYSFIYCITDITSSKRYYGKRIVDDKGLWRYYKSSSKYIKAQIASRPKDFKFEIVATCQDETASKIIEATFILKHQTYDPEYGFNANIILNIRRAINMKDRFKLLMKEFKK